MAFQWLSKWIFEYTCTSHYTQWEMELFIKHHMRQFCCSQTSSLLWQQLNSKFGHQLTYSTIETNRSLVEYRKLWLYFFPNYVFLMYVCTDLFSQIWKFDMRKWRFKKNDVSARFEWKFSNVSNIKCHSVLSYFIIQFANILKGDLVMIHLMIHFERI